MKRFQGVIRWTGILLAPLLIHALAPNLALNVLNTIGARMLLTSAQLREALSWMEPSPVEEPAVESPAIRDKTLVNASDPPNDRSHFPVSPP